MTGKEISEIKETVGLFTNLSRTELNATICEHLEWFTASGGYKLDACMKLLEVYEGGISTSNYREIEKGYIII